MTSTPEAPQAPDNKTGAPNFVEGHHPTDKVAPFGRDAELTEEHVDKLEERGVPGVDAIDPVTLDVPVEKIELSTDQATPTVETPAPAISTQDRIIPPALPPTEVETAEQPKKNRKGLWMGIGAAAASATAAALLTLGLTGGDEVKAEKPDRETTSVAPQPIETEPASPEPTAGGEVVDPTEGLEILKSSGTAQEVLGDFSQRVSTIINARANGGGVETDNADLQYLTNELPGSENPALANFENFVQNMTSNLLDSRELGAKQGIDFVNIAVISTYAESEPTADGGFIIEAVDEYWAIGEDGQSIGNVISNIDAHRYIFNREDVTLPDGSVKNTFVLTGFEPGSAEPSEVLQ